MGASPHTLMEAVDTEARCLLLGLKANAATGAECPTMVVETLDSFFKKRKNRDICFPESKVKVYLWRGDLQVCKVTGRQETIISAEANIFHVMCVRDKEELFVCF